eukprot:GSMAST32.ASY1.ANO1.1961.1 assembled CDS
MFVLFFFLTKKSIFFSYELLYLTIFFFKYFSKIHAENAGINDVLRLEWHWGFKDSMYFFIIEFKIDLFFFTMKICLGNEIGFIGTFSSGISMRIILHDYINSLIQNFIPKEYSDMMSSSSRVQFSTLEHVALRAGNGVGDCAGGPFRMLYKYRSSYLIFIRTVLTISGLVQCFMYVFIIHFKFIFFSYQILYLTIFFKPKKNMFYKT